MHNTPSYCECAEGFLCIQQGTTHHATDGHMEDGVLSHAADKAGSAHCSASATSTCASKKIPISEDTNLTFHPEIRPSSHMRPPPTLDSLFEGKRAAKAVWLKAQHAAQEEAYHKAHPFKPSLSPQPPSMAHVRGTLSISNPRFLEFHRRRHEERQALAHQQALMREVRFDISFSPQ
jgi:hypothetical protein